MYGLIRVKLIIVLIACSVVLTFAACCGVNPYSDYQKKALKTLDEAAQYSDEFGSASISSPLLVPAHKKDSKSLFEYNPGLTDHELFRYAREEASVQSASALYTQFALGIAVSGKADIPAIMKDQAAMEAYQRRINAYKVYDDTIIKVATDSLRKDLEAAQAESDPAKKAGLIAEAKKKFAETTGMDQSPAYPDAAGSQDVTVTKPQTDTLKGQAVTNMGDLLKQFKNNALKTPVRSALLSSVGDKATLGMLSALTDPAEYGDSAGKKFLFGVSMVSVRPGWRTTKDFTADVSVRTSFMYKPARSR